MLCPYCRKNPSAGKPLYPFCSERCKAADFGRWAKQDYSIAGKNLDLDDLDQLSPAELDALAGAYSDDESDDN
ncbi:MAG: DNA gyrase inhibitor YacG [Bdellovibrionota bacterium]